MNPEWILKRSQISGIDMMGGIVTWLLICENPKHFATKNSYTPNPFESRPANNSCSTKVWNPDLVPNR